MVAVATVAVIASPLWSAATASNSSSTSASLVSESDWVGPHTKMHLSLRVRSPLPSTDLGVKLTLYSRLTSRYAFGLSEAGNEPSSELVLGATPIIPITELYRRGAPSAPLALTVRIVTAPSARATKLSSPVLALDCAAGTCNGVYPLEVVLVDRATDKPLTSFTTDVIYVSGTAGTYPLDVAFVLSLGTGLGLAPDGSSTISLARISAIDGVVRAITAASRTAVTVNAYSQILLSLQRSHDKAANETLQRLRALVANGTAAGRIEMLDAPFTEVSSSELARAGLGRDFARQFATGHAIAERLVGASQLATPYLTMNDVTSADVQLLGSAGLTQVVVPESTLASVPPTTPTAPFTLQTGAKTANGPEAFVADAGLAAQLRSNGDPVLAAHNFLADLAQTFFEEPFSVGPRGVVVAPQKLPNSSRLVSIVLNGLASSPFLHATTLDGLYSDVPIGSNAAARSVSLNGSRSAPSTDLGQQVFAARSMLTDLQSVIPTDVDVLNRSRNAILLAETSGIAIGAEARYLAEPNAGFATVRASLALTGTRTVTIGQHRARIPVTFDSNFPAAVHADLRITSGAFALSPGEAHQPIVLARKNTEHEVDVTSRTSGVSTLNIQLVSPVGKILLLQGGITIRSTAFSIVAVIISVLALLVLAAWWVRTMLRRRRRHALERQLSDASNPT
jgi:hypothetical protein